MVTRHHGERILRCRAARTFLVWFSADVCGSALLGISTLNITGGCFLMQSVVNVSPGRLPPEPPIAPASPPPS